MERIGEIAAFGTAVCWTICAVFFETASRRVGATAVNFFKVCWAFVFLAAVRGITLGIPVPVDVPARSWLWMTLSGLVGFVGADFFLFNAYVWIGSRTTMLFLALSPPITALLGRIFLGERMPPDGLAGMALVCAGIMLAILGKKRDRRVDLPKEESVLLKGYLFALMAALWQSIGMIFTKIGAAGCDAVAGTQIRVLAAILGFAVFAVLSGEGRRVFIDAPRDGISMRKTAVGAVFGPFLGVTLSVFALQKALAGTVSSLIGLTPVLIIPPSVLVLKQKVGLLEVLGALLAVGGTIVFFL